IVDSVGLQHRTTVDGADSSTVSTSITQERVIAGTVLGGHHSALSLWRDQPVRQVTTSSANSSQRGCQITNGVGAIQCNSGRAGQNIEVRTWRSAMQNSRVELATQCRRKTASQLSVQSRQVT